MLVVSMHILLHHLLQKNVVSLICSKRKARGYFMCKITVNYFFLYFLKKYIYIYIYKIERFLNTAFSYKNIEREKSLTQYTSNKQWNVTSILDPIPCTLQCQYVWMIHIFTWDTVFTILFVFIVRLGSFMITTWSTHLRKSYSTRQLSQNFLQKT